MDVAKKMVNVAVGVDEKEDILCSLLVLFNSSEPQV
jgi:hypothetical protein